METMKSKTTDHDLEQWGILLDTKTRVHCLATSDCPLGCRIIAYNLLRGTLKDQVSDKLRKTHANNRTKKIFAFVPCTKTKLRFLIRAPIAYFLFKLVIETAAG